MTFSDLHALNILSEPAGAEVYLDDTYIGMTSADTPHVINDLLEGTYALKFIRGGYYDWEGEISATNTPFYASERQYKGVSISYGVPDFEIVMPVFPALKYQIMKMQSSNYYVGMAIGFALPYGAYYVADKYFDVSLFDLTIHTGVGTKLTTYHVFAGLSFTFGNRLGEIQRGFNLEVLLEAAWGGSLKQLDKKEEAFVSLLFRHGWTSALYITTFIRYDNQPFTEAEDEISSGPTTLMAVGLEYHFQ